MHPRAKDITGLRVGYLVAKSYAGSDGRRSQWNVLCTACGRTVLMPASELTKMQRRCVQASCGCMKAKTLSARKKTHGMSKHPAFAVWRSMKQRCTEPTHPAWKNYGGRGITVCARWRHSFESFWEDMGPTWKEGLDLDRRDNDAGYSPENCRWVTRRENSNNRRKSVIVNGRPITYWAEITGVPHSTLLYRLSNGCPLAHLFDKPDPGQRYKSLI